MLSIQKNTTKLTTNPILKRDSPARNNCILRLNLIFVCNWRNSFYLYQKSNTVFMETSYFMELNTTPDNENLKIAIGDLFPFWVTIRDFTFEKYPLAIEEWFVSVKKFGWSFRIKDKKKSDCLPLAKGRIFFCDHGFRAKSHRPDSCVGYFGIFKNRTDEFKSIYGRAGCAH
jgi:hypothetical protein